MQCPHCQAANADAADLCFGCGAPLGPAGLRQGAVLAGRYELLQPLGSGGMGMVFKAHDRKLDETLALKVLRPEVASREDMARRFHSEIKLARKVRHPHVCAIHEYGEDGALRYITMEFIEGVDLRQVLARDGPFPPARAYELALQIAGGLKAIHDAGVIHRDLKSPNIMLDPAGQSHLMDFGIAKRADHQGPSTSTGIVAGNPEYMSPEQARGESVDARSDIYALGVVIFELFAGRVPFRGETPVATIFKHIQEAPPLTGPGAPALPPALVPVLARCLAKEPGQRFASATDLMATLEKARAAGTDLATAPAVAGAGAAAASWTCPRCRRHVPARVLLCRCGTSRAESAPTELGPAPVAAPRAPAQPRSSRLPWLLAGGSLVVALLAVGLLASRHGAPPLPSPAARRAPPAPAAPVDGGPDDPAGISPTPPAPEPAGDEPGLEPVPVAGEPPVAAAAVPAPAQELAAPGPAPDEPSEVERLRGLGAQAFDATLTDLARRAAEWHRVAESCFGRTGLQAESPQVTLPSMSLGGCSLTREEAASTGREIVADLARAEDKARRSWVTPGTQRELREKHGLDPAAVQRLEAEVRAVER